VVSNGAKAVVRLLISGALLFFVINRLFFFSPTFVEQWASAVTVPLLYAQRALVEPLRRWVTDRKTVALLQQQNEQLCAERDDLIAELLVLKNSHQFEQNIQELLVYKDRYNSDYLMLAQIILKHSTAQTQYVLVDKGTADGIKVDMVAVYKNCLVGRVVEVFEHLSKIILITDATCKVAALCSKTAVAGIHEGTGCSTLSKLTHVNHLFKLEVNDMIISSGEGLVFPQGFGLGVIEQIERAGMYYDVTVKPLMPLGTLTHCFLLSQQYTTTV
jgi:rod shape-determining protein MreC